MRFFNETGSEKVEQAIQYFLDKAPKIIKAINDLPPGSMDFTYTTLSNQVVAFTLKLCLERPSEYLTIRTYKPLWRWSKAVGKTECGSPFVYINAYKLNDLTVKEIAGLIAHEFTHQAGFSHGSNGTQYIKMLSVPYAFGYLVSEQANFPLAKYRPHVVD